MRKSSFVKLFSQVPRSSNSQKHKFCRVIFASLRQSEKQFLQSLFLQVVGPRAVEKAIFESYFRKLQALSSRKSNFCKSQTLMQPLNQVLPSIRPHTVEKAVFAMLFPQVPDSQDS